MIDTRAGPEGPKELPSPEQIQALLERLDEFLRIGDVFSKTSKTLKGSGVEDELTQEEKQIYGYP